MNAVRQILKLVLLSLLFQTPLAEDRQTLRHFKVASEPEGADVYVITGKVGTTPLFVSERDIYPNRYPKEKQDLYGRVVIRKAGCAEFSKRVTRDDIRHGLTAHLQCKTEPTRAEASSPSEGVGQPPVQHETSDTPDSSETPAQRRLRQLRVIEELSEEGLLEPEQARKIRRRILQAD